MNSRWRRYLRFFGPNVDADVDDELRFHLEMRARDYEARGLSADAARQAAQYAGADVNVWLTAGRAMVALGRPEEAQVYFDRAMQVAPNNPEAMTRLGLVKAALGDLPTAIQLFKRALAVSPGYPPAAQALAKATAR